MRTTEEQEIRWLAWAVVDYGGSLQNDGLGAAVPRRTDRVFKWVAAVAAACLVGFVVFVIVRGPSKPSGPSSAALASPPPAVLTSGTIAPAFSLTSLGGGQPVTLAHYRGRPVIVNFFASWCPDCRAELAAVASVARTSASSVAVVGVDSNESSDATACTLDPGGTPCSECIVDGCCQETEDCLGDTPCVTRMACFQGCVAMMTAPATCAQMCCTDATCEGWTSCVAQSCLSLCL